MGQLKINERNGGTKRQVKGISNMNSDIKNNILTIALEAKQHELEQARMQLEDQQAKIIEATDKLKEEVSFIHSSLYHRKHAEPIMYEAACDAMEILYPGDPKNYD